MPFACRAELRFAAAVPRGCGVLRYVPNTLMKADRDCLAGLYPGAGRRGAEVLVRASSSETAEGSGGPPASHVKMRRPPGAQCFQSKPEPAAPGQPAGPS